MEDKNIYLSLQRAIAAQPRAERWLGVFVCLFDEFVDVIIYHARKAVITELSNAGFC
jgi:hypothetical protein